MKISEVYEDYVGRGYTKDEAAGICLGIMSGGLIDATDDETYSMLKQEFINKQKENNG